MKPRKPQMLRKTVRLSGVAYDLVVACNEGSKWIWAAIAMQDGQVIKLRYMYELNECPEAMKEAYTIALIHAGIHENYPEDYSKGWRDIEVDLELIPPISAVPQ